MKQELVLVPGLLCDAALWEPQVGALSDIAECWIPEILSEDTISGMAQAVLRDVPFQRFALAGLSMGGYVCMEIMRRAPERVTALALLGTRATGDAPDETQRRHDLIRLVGSGRGFQPVTSRMLPLLIHASRLHDATLADTVSRMAERVGVGAYVRQQHAVISRPDSRDDLPRFRVPAMVLCGRQDAITTLANHEEMANLIPAAELVVIENCGHLSTLERPDEVNGAMRHWLGPISNEVKSGHADRS